MPVRVGDLIFSDWVCLPFDGGWTDTFIFPIDARHGLPPFTYRSPLRRIAARLSSERPGASLWIQVHSPGEWFAAEVKHSILPDLPLPYLVTRLGEPPSYFAFSSRPERFPSPRPLPAVVDTPELSWEELKCLQVLGRICKGDEVEIASLAGLSESVTRDVLERLQSKKWVVLRIGHRLQKDTSKPRLPDPCPLWHPQPIGLSLALRSWGIPRRMQFKIRREAHLYQIGTGHRRTARRWTAWLTSAYPRAEIWAGWSEVRIPRLHVIPDGLTWGKIQGFETLFWLEVGDEHKSREEIEEITKKRVKSALKFCRRTGVRLVYAQISPPWVQDIVRWVCNNLPPDVSVILANRHDFGKLPTVEWGKITST